MNTNQVISDEAFDKWLSGEMPTDKEAETPATPVAVEQEASPVEKQEVVVDDAKFDQWLSGDLEEEYSQPLDEQYAQDKQRMENEIKRRLEEIPFSIGFGDFTYTADDTKWSDIIGTDAISALVGFGYGMVDTIRGIKQLLNMDVEEEKQNEAAMRTLLGSDEYGTEAFAGMIGGAILDPAGIAMGGPLGIAATKIQKIENLSNIAKYSLAGGVIGGVQTGTGYIDDESGITRPMMIGLGVVGGGAAGFIGGKLVDRAAAKELNQQLDSIRFFEGEVARKVESGLNLNDAIVKIADDFPLLKAEVDSAVKATGVQPDFVSAIRNAPIEKEASRGLKPLDGISRGLREFGNGVDKALGIISTRIKNINPRTAGKMRWYDAAVSARPEKYGKMRADFAALFPTTTGRKGVKSDWVFNDQEIIGLNRMLNKGDFEGVRSFLKLRRGDDAVKAFNKSLKVNDELGEELVKYGLLKKEELVDNYWHISIPKENRAEFMELMKVSQPDISKSWEERLAKLNESSLRKNGHVLSEFQEGLAFQKFVLGGADTDDIAVHGFLKKRKKMNWSPEMLRLQASPIESMDSYIHGAVQEIEKAKFFTPDVYASGYKGNADGVFDLGKVLDHYEANFMKGMDVGQQKELKEILRLRFGNAMVGASTATQTYKAMVNISLLANAVSAITQLGDIGVAMYKNGVRNTLSSALGVVNQRLTGKTSRITIEDLGLEQRFQEWEDVSKAGLNRMQDFFFKWSGFSEVDRLGKEAFVNSSAKKMVDIVNNPSGKAYKDWVKKNQKFLGADMSNVLDSFKRYAKSGDKADLGDDGLAYLFSELANIQPISRSEVPEFYLRGDSGKLLFTLKTFMLKQLDIIRNDGWNMIKEGKLNGDAKMMREGSANLVRYLGIVGATNIAATHLKDLVSGREDLDSILPEEVGAHLAVSAFTELMLSNMKTFGLDPFTLEKLTTEGGLAEAAGEIVLPPFLPAANEAWKLMVEGELTTAEKKRLWGYFPVIGRVINQRIYQESGSMFDPEKEQGSVFEPVQDQPSMFKDEGVQNFAEGGLVQDDNPLKTNEPPLTAAMEQAPAGPSTVMPAQAASQPLQEENVAEPTSAPSNQPEESTEAMQARMTAPKEGKEGMTHEPPEEMGEKGKAVMDAFGDLPEEVFEWFKNDVAAVPQSFADVATSFIPGYDLAKAVESGDPTSIMTEVAMEAVGPIGDAMKVMKKGITVSAEKAGKALSGKIKEWKDIIAKTNDPQAAYDATRIYMDQHNKVLQYAVRMEDFKFSPPGYFSSKMSNVVSGGNWDEVFKLSPEFKDIRVEMGDLGGKYTGRYDPNRNLISIEKNLGPEERKVVLLHEFQHGVQKWHQLTGGTNTEMYDILLDPVEAGQMKYWVGVRGRIEKDLKTAKNLKDALNEKRLEEELSRLKDDMKPLELKAYRNYEAKKGESEATWTERSFQQNVNFDAQKAIHPGTVVWPPDYEKNLLINRLPDEAQKGMVKNKIWTDKPE